MQSAAMTRKEYLRQQKQEKGRKIIGVFPAQYPRELLWALGALPVEIWDPPLEINLANAHLQPYICGVAKLGLELVLSGRADIVDAFLFPHTCDSLQNLASVVHDYCGLDKPCFFLGLPKAPFSDASREYYGQQLMALAKEMEPLLGPLEPERLAGAVRTGQDLARLTGQLYQRRAEGLLNMSNQDFYQALRRGEYLHPDDFLPELEGLLAAGPAPRSHQGPRVVLSGVLPSPTGFLAKLDQLGVLVAHDDLLCCGRRLLAAPRSEGDPIQALVQAFFSLPPCTTRASALDQRLDHLLGLIQAGQAQGVIFHLVKFCEPEYFDLPVLLAELKQRGVATLVMEMEPGQPFSGQMATRLEAFGEMLG